MHNRRLVIVIGLEGEQLDWLPVNGETRLRCLNLDGALYQLERSGAGGEFWNDNLIGAVAAKSILAFFQPKQSDQRQPSTVTLKIGPALLLPLREFERVSFRIDVRSGRLASATANDKDQQQQKKKFAFVPFAPFGGYFSLCNLRNLRMIHESIFSITP